MRPITAPFLTITQASGVAQAGGVLYVGSNQAATGIGAYDQATGVAVPGFTPITGFTALGLAVLGNTLYVADRAGGNIRTYNATTGALINSAFVAGAANGSPADLAIAGNVLYVLKSVANTGVSAYDVNTGAALAGFVPISTSTYFSMAVSGNTLYVSSDNGGGSIGTYNATTGAAINAAFITGTGTVRGLRVFNNTLYVSRFLNGAVGTYDATTGAAINSTFLGGPVGPFRLVVAIPPSPAVTGVSPASGPAAGGTSVMITGTGFTGPTTVSFGGTAGTGVTVNSPTQITATAPAHAAGAVDVVVTTGTGVATGTGLFTYLAAPPTVTAVSPASGPLAGGASVMIFGSNLTGATAVSFGGTAAANFTVDSAMRIPRPCPRTRPGRWMWW